MYFDPRPKKKKDDLFNREAELKKFSDALTYAPMIIITGLRRSGKTSFMNVALAESQHPYISLDLRGLPYNPSRADIVRKIEATFNRIDRKWLANLLSILRHVKGVTILGNAISLDWSKAGIDLAELFDTINDWAQNQNKRFLVAFDEIQLIRGDKSIPRLFAHITEVDNNITLVLTGSEVGLLFDFLRFDDTESPLFGRHYAEIKMQNFEADKAKAFLIEGFKQTKIEASEEAINYAIQKLNGSIGWLTLFGAKCRDYKKCNESLVNETVVEGGKLVRAEALKLTRRSPRYGTILNFLANVGLANWTQIKATLEAKEGRSLPNSEIADKINVLKKTGFISKADGHYKIIDPLLISGIQQEPLPE